MLCVRRGVFVFLHWEDEDSVMSFAQPGTSVFLPAVFFQAVPCLSGQGLQPQMSASCKISPSVG